MSIVADEAKVDTGSGGGGLTVDVSDLSKATKGDAHLFISAALIRSYIGMKPSAIVQAMRREPFPFKTVYDEFDIMTPKLFKSAIPCFVLWVMKGPCLVDPKSDQERKLRGLAEPVLSALAQYMGTKTGKAWKIFERTTKNGVNPSTLAKVYPHWAAKVVQVMGIAPWGCAESGSAAIYYYGEIAGLSLSDADIEKFADCQIALQTKRQTMVAPKYKSKFVVPKKEDLLAYYSAAARNCPLSIAEKIKFWESTGRQYNLKTGSQAIAAAPLGDDNGSIADHLA